MTGTAAVVLAAGQGTRMHSRLPKVLHPLAGRPMLEHVLASLAAAGIEEPVVVVGHGAEQVEALLAGRTRTVRQEPQKGTADAVRAGLEQVAADARQVVVAMADAPLVPASLFAELLEAQAAGKPVVSARATGVVDAVVDGETSLLFPVGDAAALTKAVTKLLRNKALASRLARAGQDVPQAAQECASGL